MKTQIKTTIRSKLVAVALMLIACIPVKAQQQKDTLIINAGSSQIMFLINDRQDLNLIEDYDLNAILKELRLSLEQDTTGQEVIVKDVNGEKQQVKDTTIIIEESTEEYSDNKPKKKWSNHTFNIDLGTNNYLDNGKFPDADNAPYSVRPFGSWYVGLASVNKTNISDHFYLEWGPSITWYNFKFQNDRIRVSKENDGLTFAEDNLLLDADFKKSKLTVSYINFSLVPMFQFGSAPERNNWSIKKSSDCFSMEKGVYDHTGGFRIGLGGYGGYRIGSYTKVVYDDGDKERDKDKNNFYLNNFRYGLRLQAGYRGTDIFFNYDLNELFSEGKGPQLNAFSFGIIL